MVSATTLAEHSWDGPGPWWPLFPLLWLALIVGVFVVATRFGRRRQRGSYAGESRLAERFAAGEIDAVEYREKLAVLHEKDR